jgi:hypothetical protein
MPIRIEVFIFEVEMLKNSYGTGVISVTHAMWNNGLSRAGHLDMVVDSDFWEYWVIFSAYWKSAYVLPKVYVRVKQFGTVSNPRALIKSEVRTLYNVRVTKVELIKNDVVNQVDPVPTLRLKFDFDNSDEALPASLFPFLDNILDVYQT